MIFLLTKVCNQRTFALRMLRGREDNLDQGSKACTLAFKDANWMFRFIFFMLSPRYIKASAMHHSKHCPFMNVYEMIAQHRALQTRPMIIWIWTFLVVAPNISLLLAYETKTSIHLPVPFVLPIYLLHLLSDILSFRPERLTRPLSLVGDHRCHT